MARWRDSCQTCSGCKIYLYAEDMANNNDGMLSQARLLALRRVLGDLPLSRGVRGEFGRSWLEAITFSVPPSNWLDQKLELTSTPTAPGGASQAFLGDRRSLWPLRGRPTASPSPSRLAWPWAGPGPCPQSAGAPRSGAPMRFGVDKKRREATKKHPRHSSSHRLRSVEGICFENRIVDSVPSVCRKTLLSVAAQLGSLARGWWQLF